MKHPFQVFIETNAKPPYPVVSNQEASKFSTAVFRAVREFERGRGKAKQHGVLKIIVRKQVRL